MTHLELMEKVLNYAEIGRLPDKESLEFQDYIEAVKKTVNSEVDHHIRNKIKQKVKEVNGCKITELVADIDLVEQCFNNNINLTDEIFEMIKAGELVEVEYILPHLSFRIKSFLFPKGTEVRLGNEYELIRSLEAQIAEYKRKQY